MNLQLSNRLQFIAKLIEPSGKMADIGSDHAYLPCYVCLQNKQMKAIAGEVADGPYERALETVRKFQLENRIDVRLGNGLEVFNQEDGVTDVVIAGMGGTLISNILHEGKSKTKHINRFILQPNNNEIKVRRTLLSLGFTLTEEYILEENDLIYEILVAERNEITSNRSPYKCDIQNKQLWFGPFLMEERASVFIKKWHGERDKLLRTITQMKMSKDKSVQEKIKIFKERIKWIEEVIS